MVYLRLATTVFCSLQGFSRLATLKMEAVGPEHRWTHSTPTQQHENSHGSERVQPSEQHLCSLEGYSRLATLKMEAVGPEHKWIHPISSQIGRAHV